MPGKVIVCDDQELVREVLSGFLMRKGYEVAKANSGQDCLELIKLAHYDFVFLDVKMPQMDGLSVMREIKLLDKKVQVILISGIEPNYSNEEQKQDATFLLKPFTLENALKTLAPKHKSKANKILIVDDQDMLREMLKDFLSEEGYEITEARDGNECLAHTQKSQFDAIFMDVRMPHMDGLEALRKLREQGSTTPVFLMSGFGDVGSVEEAQDRGAQNFLPKPFKLEKALEMLDEKKN